MRLFLEDRGVDAIPADGSDDRIKHDNLVVQYSRAMSCLREILNHTFLRAVYHTSSKQAMNMRKFKGTLLMIIPMMIPTMNQ